MEDQLKLKATLEVDLNEELYKIIDFLNKNLKNKNLIFGLTKQGDKNTISIYEV